MKRFMVVLAVVLSSCAPGFRFGDSWAREIFKPSVGTVQQACAISMDQTMYGDKPVLLGAFSKEYKFGTLGILSGTTATSITCAYAGLQLKYSNLQSRASDFRSYLYSTSEFQELAKVSTASIFIDGPAVSDITLRVVLLNEKGVRFAELKSNPVRKTDDGIIFDFDNYSDTDLKNLDLTQSFEIVMTRAGSDLVYTVMPDNFSALSRNK